MAASDDAPHKGVAGAPVGGEDVPDPGGEAPDSLSEEFQFASDLNALVAAGQGELLMDVFARTLEQPISEQTWDDLIRAVNLLVGGIGLIRELIWAARVRPETMRADFETEGVSTEGQALLTQILVRYGAPLRKAYALSPLSSFPDDWEFINPEVLMNVTDDELEVSTFIRKKNGESIRVRGGASGFMRWLSIMHEALLLVGDRARFRPGDIERLLEQLEASRTMLASTIEDQAEDG